jgi:glycosyltransferase involved in cell wall biosynthesis
MHKKKRLLIDVSNLTISLTEFKRTGIQEVIYQVLINIPKLRDRFPEYEIWLAPFLPNRAPLNGSPGTPAFIFEEIEDSLRLPSRDIWGFDLRNDHKFEMSHEAILDFLSGGDAIHFQNLYSMKALLNYMRSEYLKTYERTSCTAYDITPILYPEYAVEGVINMFKNHYIPGFEMLDQIISISRHTMIDVHDFLLKSNMKIPKLSYIHLPGYSANTTLGNQVTPPDLAAQLKDLNYFVVIGSLEPRKNIAILIKAFQIFKETDRDNFKLVFIGKSGWKANSIYAAIEENPLAKENILFTGYLEDRPMLEVVKGSKGLCMISCYEGFGIPLAMAASLGAPVMTNLGSSLPEACQYQGVFVDSHDEWSIASGFRSLSKARRLSSGFEFSWPDYTEHLLNKLLPFSDGDGIHRED